MDNNNNTDKVVYLRLDDIIPNRFQPREVFDETGLEELADSIKEHGVIQPIIVRQIGDKYELIAGERRSKASAIAGLTTIPAIIRNMDDKESAKVSLLENLQRRNLSAIEEARTYKKILELDNMTQEDLAKTMGKSQPLIANKLRLLSLPEEIQDALIKNQISERHARSLLNVKDKQQQLIFLDRIKNERLTVRDLDMEIKKNNENNANDSQSDRISYNNFNQKVDLPTNNYQNSFGNMGLNDYHSNVNNSFNNIPSNYQFNNMPGNSQLSENLNFDSGINNNNDFQINNFSNQENFSSIATDNNQNQSMNSFSSLGSMFDSQNTNTDINDSQYSFNSDDTSNNNFFVSQIKESNVRKYENQFLPNLDDMPIDNDDKIQGDFSNNQIEYGTNTYNNFESNNMNNLQNNLDFSFSNNSFNNASGFDDVKKYNEPIVEYSGTISEYQDNKGDLFNQPLNLVDISSNNASTNVNKNEIQNENSTLENEREVFDNPFDDPYENILFAKPVPIESPQENNPNISSNVEVIETSEVSLPKNDKEIVENTKNETSKAEYISLDPVKTIFDTRGAVLELKKTTDQIKQNNIKIDTEEIDYDDYYEIIIRIRK